MLNILDKIAGGWLNFRIRQNAEVNFGEAKVEDIEFKTTGAKALLSHPNIVHLTDEFAGLLNEVGAENYFVFDMMPRPDRSRRPIRVTIQWADGLSPDEKIEQLEAEIASFRRNRLNERERGVA